MALQEVTLQQLQPGDFVVRVSQQTGDVLIKEAGLVRSQKTIELLRKKGVLRVLIDPDLAAHKPPPSNDDATGTDSQTTEAPDESEFTRVDFSTELPKAEKTWQQLKQKQSRLFDSCRRQQPIDLELVQEVSCGLADSVSRNQDVLLCLSRIAQSSDDLLQHAINCAVYMAAFGQQLQLSKGQLQDLIMAALLHDMGKVTLGAATSDIDAIPASLKLLAPMNRLPAEVSLWVAQHCAYLDGSGSPKGLKGHQISQGGRMLAIVNQYDNLSHPIGKKPLNPQLASKKLLEKTPDQLDSELTQRFIRCIGIYPPGSVVKLHSGKLALVLENNPKKPTQPKVKVFYHSQHQHHLPAKVLDLAKHQEEYIDYCIDLEQYGLQASNYL
ncbi:HD-GYP domain-containing protein [Alkalimonas amylolytica]|uniref:HD-GYP domain, c-di-GMP phosphodiesterase class II (Or its inactivated variant) n=1 Tax=Alkalimonas amylolytica TaxID=152573 RepID=A0A1H3XNN1_ALKAM|nr:HD-GYP domain-containing protein [Alkalimonas amylolytica]SEA00860.1 HD-GYP domain, c-di-GMP phosphodiesterase class II (or its inactivated variant) [Alkalimonas amylolytica]